MHSYINGIGVISPQKTVESTAFLEEVIEYTADFLPCIDPNYKNFIDPIASRRMSRLIKMGVASAKICLADAQCTMPDGIITGTGLGSVEDTEKILGTVSDESPITNPTPFIQSTYNTISSQIAIALKCTNYNSTYVHRIFSFESGLQDGLLQIEEKPDSNILIVGIDEMTLNHLSIIRRLGYWKKEASNNLRLLDYSSPGTVAGQGASCFLISGERGETTYARLMDVCTLYKPTNNSALEGSIMQFLDASGVSFRDIDLVITGINGDQTNDAFYHRLTNNLFPGIPLAYFKHLCGEYHTASGFSLWVAANILRRQVVPSVLMVQGQPPEKVHTILIINHNRESEVSLMLVSE
jgi:3-oxoacyl-[acyl-carrier-protein] synthase II